MLKFVSVVGIVVIACGCASATEPRLSYEGHSNILATNPTLVDATVTVRNSGSVAANIPVPPCPLTIAAHATADRNDEPLWRSGSETCVSDLMILPPIIVAPGDFYDFKVQATLPVSLVGKRVFLTMSIPAANPIPIGQVVVK
jgi:hypothetical protein